MKKIHSFLATCTAFTLVYVYLSIFRTDPYLDEPFLHVESQTFIKIHEDQFAFRIGNDLKYVLMWTHEYTFPFVFLEQGTDAFIKAKCAYTNCFIAKERELLGDYTLYDVILFHAPEYTFPYKAWDHGMPTRRSPHQKYVFTSIESSHNYPVCDRKFEAYFNWTWTYRLDSDIVWGYTVVRDLGGKVIGPAKNIAWDTIYNPISEEKQASLARKSKAVVWFASNCKTISLRERFVRVLKTRLAEYNLTLDVFGKCGSMMCPRGNQTNEYCEELVKENYYFYLAFENSFAEDYVTEKVLHGTAHDAVPIVFGGADYSRFLPPGSYIDGRKLGPTKLAQTINAAVQNPAVYHEYFGWTTRYRLSHQSRAPDTNPLCLFCAALNDRRRMEQPTSWRNFKDWWNPPDLRC